MYNLYNIMALIVDIIIMVVLLILTIHIILYNISNIMDGKLNNLKNDIVNIKCGNKNILPKTIEKFSGSLPDYTETRDDSVMDYISNKSNSSTEELLEAVINDEDISKIENPNFNTLNNLPYLIDPQNPNEGYYYNRVKLITNPNSPLLKKAKKNMERIDLELKKCANNNLTNNRDIGGYNKYEDLSEDSYSNVTSIGKSLLTPYSSYPLPS